MKIAVAFGIGFKVSRVTARKLAEMIRRSKHTQVDLLDLGVKNPELSKYDQVIFVGTVWGGKVDPSLINPLKTSVRHDSKTYLAALSHLSEEKFLKGIRRSLPLDLLDNLTVYSLAWKQEDLVGELNPLQKLWWKLSRGQNSSATTSLPEIVESL